MLTGIQRYGMLMSFYREGKFGQDYFTLFSTYFEGRPPKSVNMHFRRFRIKDIPVHDTVQFDLWLRQRWVEKDDLVEYYNQNGRFPEDKAPSGGRLTDGDGSGGMKRRSAKEGMSSGLHKQEFKSIGATVETEVKLQSIWEVLDIYSTLA